MDSTKQAVLARYGVADTDFIARGMEAEAYQHGADAVLKLYSAATPPIADLRRLQSFYAALQHAQFSYAVPHIRHVAEVGTYRVSIEARLTGVPLAAQLAATPPAQLDTLFASYTRAVLELSSVPMPPDTQRYKLFDSRGLSRSTGDWHAFLGRWLAAQQQTLAPYFARDVADYEAKRARMNATLRQPYRGVYRLVHGDICPANVLVSADGRVGALLDFGLLTMYGDPLFDAATAWVFFDMYDELRANVRERLLRFFLEQLGEQARGFLYRYVLLYSLLSANLYAADCSDGHYAWCVANLNTPSYWDEVA